MPRSPLQSPRRWLLLPIESNLREFDARVLLAGVAARRGLEVVLCRLEDQRHVLGCLPRSVTLNINLLQAEQYEHIRAGGHVVTALDEEGLVYRDEDEYVRRRVSRRALQQLDRVFAWGEVHAELLAAAAPAVSDRVLPVGNPRMDLLRPEFASIHEARAERLRSELGDFVLVNSNFGTANHRLGRDQMIANWRKQGWVADRDSAERFERILALQDALLDHFVRLVQDLAEVVAPRRIVVRPHPSEDLSFWTRSLGHLDTVQVRRDGGVIPWLLACGALIHNGCTTGIEAAILGRPTFAFLAERDPEVEASLPNDVSVQFTDAAALISATERALDDAGAPSRRARDARGTVERSLLQRHVANTAGRLASEAIVDELARLAPVPGPTPTRPRFVVELTARRGLARVRGLASAAVHARLSEERRQVAYYRDASPNIRATDVRASLHAYADGYPEVEGLHVSQLSRDVVLVRQDDGIDLSGVTS